MNLYYLAFPVQKMPVMRIIGDEIECDPLTSETIKFQFLQFPVDKRPIGRIANDQIEVSPSTLTSIRLYYLRKPAKPTWAYTISGDGRSHVYDEGSSVDIDMPEFIWQTIANKALEYLGVAMDDNMLTQFQQFNKKGKLDD